MTIAELHGKLSPHRLNGCHDRMEDLLTSDVFGTMKYAGWELGFLEWLRSAVHPFDATTARMVLPKDEDITHLHYAFWPTLVNGREPDVLIGFELSDGYIIQVMIEAKYLSGASDVILQNSERTSYYSGNQIADQINNFPEAFPELRNMPIAACIHIYVTAHYSCPTDVYENARDHIELDIPFFWVNCQSLAGFLMLACKKALTTGTCALLSDLLDLLKRKEMVPFLGFTQQGRSDFSNFIGQSYWKPSKAGWWSMQATRLPKPQHFWSK